MLYVHMFDMVDTSLNYGRGLIRLLITSGIFQDKRKYSVCDLRSRYCVFTLWGRTVEHTLYSRVSSTRMFIKNYLVKIIIEIEE